MATSVLQQVCIPENHVRSTFYSDVFRAKIHVGSNYKAVDIEHIQLPINKAREYELRHYYGLNNHDIVEYNTNLAICVRQSIQSQNSAMANAIGDVKEKQAKAVGIDYLHQEVTQDDDGVVHVYFVTDTAEAAIGPARFAADESNPGVCIATVQKVFYFMRALLLHINRMHKVGLVSGVLCGDAIVSATVQNQSGNGGEKNTIKTSLIFAQVQEKDGNYTPFVPLPTMPFNTAPSLLAGGNANEATELYSWAALFMSLINESYGTEVPDTSTPDLSWAPMNIKEFILKLESIIVTYGQGFVKSALDKALKEVLMSEDIKKTDKSFKIICPDKSYFSNQNVDAFHAIMSGGSVQNEQNEESENSSEESDDDDDEDFEFL